MADENQGAAAAQGAQQGQFGIQKIYCKDISFETPHSPDIFKEEWKPDVKLNLGNESKPLGDNVYEVVLRVTCTVNSGDKTAYLAEVQQAGIFNIIGMPEEQIGAVLGIYCPNILFPYARAVVSDLVSQGGFPQMQLAPVNFEVLYAQHMQQQAAQQSDAPTAH